MYYKLNSKRATPAFYTIKLPSGKVCDWPKNCWKEAPTEEVAKFIEREIERGSSSWERQPTNVAEPEEVKAVKKRKKANKPLGEQELPPEPQDEPVAEEVKEEAEEPAEEDEVIL